MNKTKTIRRTGRKAIRRTGRKIVRGGAIEELRSITDFNNSKEWAERWQVCDNNNVCTDFEKGQADLDVLVSNYFGLLNDVKLYAL